MASPGYGVAAIPENAYPVGDASCALLSIVVIVAAWDALRPRRPRATPKHVMPFTIARKKIG
jgi:hypothetical protein